MKLLMMLITLVILGGCAMLPVSEIPRIQAACKDRGGVKTIIVMGVGTSIITCWDGSGAQREYHQSYHRRRYHRN